MTAPDLLALVSQAADLAAAQRQAVPLTTDGRPDATAPNYCGGYETVALAVVEAAKAAFEYACRELGVTGFQASWAALKFYGETMHVDGPFGVWKADDWLYPQSDEPCHPKRRDPEVVRWLGDEAVEKLAEPQYAVPAVIHHWHRLVADAAASQQGGRR